MKKFQRLRAGVLPEWALKNQEVEKSQEKQVKYKGMTGDGAAIVVDVKYETNKRIERPQEEQQSESEENQPEIVKKAKLFGSDSSSESEQQKQDSSSSEEEEEVVVMQRPVYIPKQSREAIYGGQTLMDQARAQQDLDQQLILKQNQELADYNKQKVTEIILQEQNIKPQKGENSEDDFPFTDNSEEDEKYISSEPAFEKWKIREILRIKREKDLRSKFESEQAEIQRRRNMTEEERQAENEKLGIGVKKQQVAYNFMQKYYHKGAFYQDQQEERDVNMPTMEDKADRSVLPQILQKRMGTFGRKGNSKWTHLTAEDTTNFDPSTRVPEHIAKKLQKKQGGFK